MNNIDIRNNAIHFIKAFYTYSLEVVEKSRVRGYDKYGINYDLFQEVEKILKEIDYDYEKIYSM